MPPEAARAAAIHGKRERNKQENRQAILDAARDCFLEIGYEATSIRDVIRRTGLASGTFYNYFADKPALLHALINHRMEALTERLTTARRTAKDLRGFVHGAYLAAFESVCADPVLHTLMLKNERAIHGFYDATPMGISVSALQRDIRDAIDRDLMPPVDVEFLAAAFYGVGYEMSRVLADDSARDAGEAARFATQIFLDGIAGMPVMPLTA